MISIIRNDNLKDFGENNPGTHRSKYVTPHFSYNPILQTGPGLSWSVPLAPHPFQHELSLVFDHSHSDWCKIASQSYSDLYFPDG